MEGTGDYAMVSEANKALLINAYDNSICYTDYVLSEIIQKVEEKDGVSAVLYISDHAENLYDDGSSLVLHGSKHPTIKELHVPLFIWTSAKYKDFYGNKHKTMEANVLKKINSTNLFHSILDIAGITYPEETPEKSIASDTFMEDSVRSVFTVNREVFILDP